MKRRLEHSPKDNMKFLNPSELSKLAYIDYEGTKFIGYKFKINNSPTVRMSRTGKRISCTCKHSSIKEEKNCRYILAIEFFRNANHQIN